MESLPFSLNTFRALAYAIYAIVIILFMVNLQYTIKAAAPENRKVQSRLVWLQLIPIFGMIYSFFVAKNISKTIVAEYESKGNVPEHPKPTLLVGNSWAIVSVLLTLLTLYSSLLLSKAGTKSMTQEEWNSFTSSTEVLVLYRTIGIVVLAWFILFAIYWAQTASYKNKMKKLPNNSSESEIFGAI